MTKNKIDVVIPIPDSGNASALGYSEKIKKPFEFGIIRNHYTGRTFHSRININKTFICQTKT